MITPALKFGAEEAAHNPTADHRLVEIDLWRADELDLAAMHFGRWWPKADGEMALRNVRFQEHRGH